jgi:protein-S-isoprenylcysteine O-methyltransferase Ste14
MNTARYVLALLLVLTMVPAVLLWFIVHPFVRFWRRLGPVWTWVVLVPLFGVQIWGLASVRQSLLAIEYGTNGWLIALAVPFAIAGTVVAVKRRKYLTTRILIGVPELSAEGKQGKLLDQGIYGRIRHPRYVEIVLFVVAYALFANYLAGYATLAMTVIALYLVVLLEERELRDRFDGAYADYCRKVPRFVPRARGS